MITLGSFPFCALQVDCFHGYGKSFWPWPGFTVIKVQDRLEAYTIWHMTDVLEVMSVFTD